MGGVPGGEELKARGRTMARETGGKGGAPATPFCIAGIAKDGFCIATDIETGEALVFTDEGEAREHLAGAFAEMELYRLAEGHATAAVNAGACGRSSLAVDIIRRNGQRIE